MKLSNCDKQINCNNQIKKLKKQEKKDERHAKFVSASVSSLVPVAAAPFNMLIMNTLGKINGELNAEQADAIFKSAEEYMSKTGLKEKGVVITNFQSAGINLTPIPDKIMEYINQLSAVAAGKNALFLDKPVKSIFGDILYDKNSILLNKDKIPATVFHELGHAFNYNNSKFWKTMQKLRLPGMFLASFIALYCSMTNKSVEKDGKELTKAQKVKNAVRENAGKASFICAIPVLLEEAMASVRGCKWAKSNLPKEIYNKVLKTNAAAYTTYLLSSIALGLSAYSAVKIKDYFTQKNQAKIQAEYEKLQNSQSIQSKDNLSTQN